MAARRYDDMSQAELIAALRELEKHFSKRLHELREHQEELKAQQADLLESQRQLEQSRDRYADLYDFAPVAYVTFDGNAMIQEINLSGARLLGVERAHLIGLPFVNLVADPDRRLFLDHMVRCRRSEGAHLVTELTLRSRSGRDIAVELQTRPARNVVSAAIIDLTERHRAEDDRLRAEEQRQGMLHTEKIARATVEARDHFLAMLSHELRGPLASISFALATIRERGDVAPGLTDPLQMIDRNVSIEARLIEELLDVTRIQRDKLGLELEVVSADAILEEVARMCAGEAHARGIALSVESAAPGRCVGADAVRLRQVIWNLVDNALKQTPAGGRVTLGAIEPVPGEIQLFVRDTGAGIPPEMLQRVFEPFEQGIGRRSGGGLGLGLAICRGIVEAHHGRITVESPGPGHGCVFTVTLPTVAAEAKARPGHPAPAREHPMRRVLLVEDNPDNAAAVSEYLKLRGYEVDVAASVADALRRATAGFDVLVSDIGLPDGTGQDLVRTLRAEGPVRAIALSGYGTRNDVEQSREAGFRRHLTKPVDPEELVEAIESVAAPGESSAPAAEPSASAGRRRP